MVDGWGETRILRSAEDVAALRGGDGGGIFIHGSAELALRLAEADLIDRYNLLMFPVLLGSGKRIFPSGPREQRLALRESTAYSNGVVKVIYDVAR